MATIKLRQMIELPNSSVGSPTRPSIILKYFNLKGRAEPARLILAYAGVSYQDVRLAPPWENIEAWAAQKSSYPYGCVPVLHWDGEEIAQSLAVARFLATKFGLAGSNILEAAQVDEIIYALQDAINAGFVILQEKDVGRKKELASNYVQVTIPTVLGQIEKRLQRRGGQFLVGSKFTWADIQTFFFCSELRNQDVLKSFPGVANLVNRMGSVPNIKMWVQSRPKTPL